MVVAAVQVLGSLSLVVNSGFFVFLLGVLVTNIVLIENAGSVRNEVEIRPATASMRLSNDTPPCSFHGVSRGYVR
jgi:hypothetical protein